MFSGLYDAHPAPNPASAHADTVQRLPADERLARRGQRLPLPTERLGRGEPLERQLLGTAPGHHGRHVGWRGVEFVDEQVEHVVDLGELARVDEAAPVLAQQRAQHPDGAHHPVAPHLAFAQLAGGRGGHGG